MTTTFTRERPRDILLAEVAEFVVLRSEREIQSCVAMYLYQRKEVNIAYIPDRLKPII